MDENMKTGIETISIAEKFLPENILNTYITTIGIGVSSLGDDTSGTDLMVKAEDENKIPLFYAKVFGWKVAIAKSLLGRTLLEYLREQSHAGYIVDYKMFNKAAFGKRLHLVPICKPASHVGKTTMVEESKSRISKLIDEVALISKLYNLNLHPALDVVVNGYLEYGIAKFKLFTEPVDYVPIFNTRAWMKAGKPPVPNRFSVRISGLDSAFAMAGKEAEWYTNNIMEGSQSTQETLDEALGISWTKKNMDDYDHVSSLKASRLYRYLVAKYNKNDKLCEKIIAEVKLNPKAKEFFTTMNGVKADELDTSADVIDGIVLSHSI